MCYVMLTTCLTGDEIWILALLMGKMLLHFIILANCWPGDGTIIGSLLLEGIYVLHDACYL